MEWEYVFQGLGLATVQIRCVIIDTEEGGHVEAIHPKRCAGGGVIPDLYGVINIERPHLLEIVDGAIVTGEREKLVRQIRHWRRRREPGDTGVQERAVLSDGGGVVAVEDLALRPLGSPVAGCAIGCKDRPTIRRTRLRLM